jgi:hypothetical protein
MCLSAAAVQATDRGRPWCLTGELGMRPSDTGPRELRSRFLCGVPTSPNPPPASPTLPSLSRTDGLICSAPSLLPLFPSATHPSAATLSIVVQLLRAEGSPFASFHLQGPLHLSSLRTIGGVEGTNVGLKLSQGRSQKRMPPGSVSGPNRPSWWPTRPPEDLREDFLDDLVHHDLKTWRTRQDLGEYRPKQIDKI